MNPILFCPGSSRGSNNPPYCSENEKNHLTKHFLHISQDPILTKEISVCLTFSEPCNFFNKIAELRKALFKYKHEQFLFQWTVRILVALAMASVCQEHASAGQRYLSDILKDSYLKTFYSIPSNMREHFFLFLFIICWQEGLAWDQLRPSGWRWKTGEKTKSASSSPLS